MDSPIRISVDFNTIMRDERRRVLINLDTHRDIVHLLRPGLRVILFEGEEEVQEVEAILEYDAKYGEWWGRPDWSSERNGL